MSAPPATDPSGISTDATTKKSRIEISVKGMYWKGEETKDGEEQENGSLDGSAVTGTAVFVDRELHPDSIFTTAEGISFRPAAKDNQLASFGLTEKGGKIHFAKDETKYKWPPSIHFTPTRRLFDQKASLLGIHGSGKVQGRDDDGHLVSMTVDETVDGKEEAV